MRTGTLKVTLMRPAGAGVGFVGYRVSELEMVQARNALGAATGCFVFHDRDTLGETSIPYANIVMMDWLPTGEETDESPSS